MLNISSVTSLKINEPIVNGANMNSKSSSINQEIIHKTINIHDKTNNNSTGIFDKTKVY